MAKKDQPRAVDSAVLGQTKGQTTAKGPHGGGNAFKAQKVDNSFAILKDRQGLSMKGNLKK
jgi:hypothetical protein